MDRDLAQERLHELYSQYYKLADQQRLIEKQFEQIRDKMWELLEEHPILKLGVKNEG